jgi:hypothetical protein
VVRWRRFADMRERVAPIPLVGAGRGQRAARRAALNEEFERLDLSSVDLFVPADRGGLLEAVVPGGWHVLGLKTEPVEGDPPALLGNIDRGGADQLLWLSVLARPTAPDLARLTDIFSLAHVADLGRDEDPDGEPTPVLPMPPTPLDDTRIRIVRRRVLDEEEVRLDEQVYTYDYGGVEESQTAQQILAGY